MTTTGVDALLARQAIHDALMRYCRGIDRCDEDLVRSAYHPDSYDDHGTFKGNGWEFASVVVASLRSIPQRTMHLIGNELVEIHGDLALSESYFVAHHMPEQDGPSRLFSFHGRYIDRFELRDGDWRIAHRIVVQDWAESRLVDLEWEDMPFTRGARSHADAVYERWMTASVGRDSIDARSPDDLRSAGTPSAPTGPAT